MSKFDINFIKENLQNITEGNIIRLISDFLIPNLDKISNFSDKDIYFRNDIVYIYDDVLGKHQLFICNKDKTGPSTMVHDDWDKYTFRLQKSAILLESEYTALSDGVINIPINLPLFDPDNDKMIVFHTIRGRLSNGREWVLAPDKISINLKGFSLYKNETLYFEVIK